MNTETLNHLLHEFETTLRCKQIDPQSGHSYLRHLVESGRYWVIAVNPEHVEQLRILESLAPADHRFLWPTVLPYPATQASLAAVLLLVELFDKTRVSHGRLCATLASVPMQRAEKRRALREIAKGRGIIALGSSLVDNLAVTQLLNKIAAAPPAA